MKVKKKIGIVFLAGVIVALLFSNGMLIPYTSAVPVPPFTMNSGWTTTAPAIDGTLEPLWDSATKNYTWHHLGFSGDAYVYFLNNRTHLFLFVDIVPDWINSGGSFFYLWLDTNNSKEITSSLFLADCFLAFNYGETTFVSNPSNLIYKVKTGLVKTSNSPFFHTTLEIAIDMRSMFSAPSAGDTIGFLMAWDQSADSVPDEYLPFNFYTGLGGSILENNEGTYAELKLGAPVIPPLFPPEVVAGFFWTLSIILAVGISVGATIGGTFLIRRYLTNGELQTFPYKLKKEK